MAKRRRKANRKARAGSPSPAPAAPEPEAAGEAAPEPAAPSGSARRRAANLFIAAFLAYQIATPLHYYLDGGGYDERFSWRMFSSVRMRSCRVEVEDRLDAGDRRRVNLPQVLHVAWIRTLERGRPAVVNKFLRSRCEQAGVGGARYRLQCVGPDRSPLPERRVEIDCASGELTRSEGKPS